MSNQLISRFSLLVMSILILSSSFAQVSEFLLQPTKPLSKPTLKVYENIQTEFKKRFGNGTEITWSKVERNYLAKFSMDGQQQAVLFNPRAEIVYQISYGTVNHLPANIRKSIKRMYIEFEITSAIKVEEAGRTIWAVIVEDGTSFAHVRVENGDIEEVHKYVKHTPPSTPQSTFAKHW